MGTTESLQSQFKQFRMTETAQALPGFLREAEQQSWTYQELLVALCNHEEHRREEKTRQKYLKWAQFPFEKSLEDFDTIESMSLSKRQIDQLRECDWLDQLFNLVLLGPPGVGKTHIAIGLGLEAIERGKQVAFVSMGELISLLKTEGYVRKSAIRLKRVRQADLVILDDMMFMAMETNEANLFFQLISDLYEKSSIILTSNKGPDSWGKMLGDQGIATAILDRLLHRCEVIHMDGESHRMKHRETIFE
ncbi:IS21-like element helper ATPase IstB [Bavariicoccus seileri]|uniref:IS21-like element helper ATPase IstB n=1 Tax=Bavariicoccus seileri TaxID=549685 RepID=UPI0023E3A175|nr:IS21-like element helper ATPase IstB [Bavariicoccus seileri]